MTSDKDATEKLLDHNRQQLSALIDGALSPDEARFLLRRLQHDESLAQCLSRWQLCGDVLRGHSHAPAPAGFARDVADAIAHDTAQGAVGVQAGTRGNRARWGSGVALVASVAVLALFVTRQSPDAGPAAEPQTQVVASQPTAVPPASDIDAGAPAPQSPGAPDAAAGLAAVAAVAELPRRAAERRSRGQGQRASVRASARRNAEPRVAVAAAAPLDAATAPQAAVASAGLESAQPINPFTPRADAIATRPWPRALLPAASEGAFNVDYGRQASAAFYPFQAQAVALPEPGQSVDPRPGTESTGDDIAP